MLFVLSCFILFYPVLSCFRGKVPIAPPPHVKKCDEIICFHNRCKMRRHFGELALLNSNPRNATVTMVKGATIGPYSIYSGSSTIASAAGTKYGVSSGLFADDFKDPASLGATCAPIGTVAPSSTSSSVVSTSQSSTSSRASSTTSSTAVPTPVHKPIVGKYSFQGCFTEGTGVRALADAAFVDYANMTSELCASKCDAYVYWGIEYYGECYCGNELAASSTQAPLGDCSFICPGNPNEYCGAGNR